MDSRDYGNRDVVDGHWLSVHYAPHCNRHANRDGPGGTTARVRSLCPCGRGAAGKGYSYWHEADEESFARRYGHHGKAWSPLNVSACHRCATRLTRADLVRLRRAG